jgi:hypothetical protein
LSFFRRVDSRARDGAAGGEVGAAHVDAADEEKRRGTGDRDSRGYPARAFVASRLLAGC